MEQMAWYHIGRFPAGRYNKISDVPGVTVGHTTIDTPEHKTGVTVILPAQDNVFVQKLTAAAFVGNGFGKTTGLLQIEELGTLETPIALTNTLNVGKVQDALVSYMIARCEADGVELLSLNPVVGECNDGELNNIRHRAIGEAEVLHAIETACQDFEEGAVGAGRGTVCFGLKGGIGSSSRVLTFGKKEYVLGVLVQSNFGSTRNLRMKGECIGAKLAERTKPAIKDQGSIMMIVGTDLPLTSRQLKRVIKRCTVGLSRIGSYMGHGSGDIMIGFTTANRVPHVPAEDLLSFCCLAEERLESVFEAAADATEEAILKSLLAADTVKGLKGREKKALREVWKEIEGK